MTPPAVNVPRGNSFIAAVAACVLVLSSLFASSQASRIGGSSLRYAGDGDNRVAHYGHEYDRHERVELLLNKVGPFNNPHETYRYTNLPYCKPSQKNGDQTHGLGEILAGDRKTLSDYSIFFRDDVDYAILCHKVLSKDEVLQFRKAVEEEYYFEIFLDGLPMWGFVGDFHDDFLFHREMVAHHYIFTHLNFRIAYNGKHIVGVNVTADPLLRTDLHEGEASVDFSYSVKWVPSDTEFDHRMDYLNTATFLPGQLEIHWLSIVNSVVLAILLVSFLGIILVRILRGDISRYMSTDLEDEFGTAEDEFGWKLIHGHVFRPPQPLVLFTAMFGVGVQFLSIAFAILTMALLGIFSPTRRGGIMSAFVVLYMLTSIIAGFASGRLYRQLSKGSGASWVWNAVLTILLFPVPCTVVFAIVNSTAWANMTTAALPFGTIMVVLVLFFCVSVPLSLLGSIAGRNMSGDFEAPCRVHKVARQVPEFPFYRSSLVHYLIGGFLPFSAIYIELHYVFAAMWGHKIYTMFGILFLAILLLVLVTAFITVALAYFQLAVEDHRWWWRSFISGGSVGIFIYFYCFHYFFNRSDMSGPVQTLTFFGYMAVICWAAFLALGAVGFYSSLLFTKFIYASVKCD